MKQEITLIEARLAAFLPCVAASFAAWYSRCWRAPAQRMETLLWAGIVLAGLYVLIWQAAPFYSSRPRWVLPEGAQWWMEWGMAFAGVVSGYRAYQRISLYLNHHWLAWCLSTRQIRCERLVRGMWQGNIRIGQIILFFFALSLLIEMRMQDILVLVEWFFPGFILAFAVAHVVRLPAWSEKNNKKKWSGCLPVVVFIQAESPRTQVACFILTLSAVASISAHAVQIDRAELLVFPALIVLVGFSFMQSLMRPGAAVLHKFLAWTGISVWKITGRLMLMPVCIVMVLVCPIILSALILHERTWGAISLLEVVGAAYITLILIVHDLISMQYARGSVFVLLHMAIPMLSLFMFGPAAILVIGFHLGWLLRQGNILWGNK